MSVMLDEIVDTLTETVHEDHCPRPEGVRRWGKARHAAFPALHPLLKERGDHWQRLSRLRSRLSTRELCGRQSIDHERPAADHLDTRGQDADATGRRIRPAGQLCPWTSTQQV